jgi:hypothetical protein
LSLGFKDVEFLCLRGLGSYSLGFKDLKVIFVHKLGRYSLGFKEVLVERTRGGGVRVFGFRCREFRV